MRLSIIVPVYNMAADGKLEYCMDSLLRQTAEDFEIIAVDDASTDGSPDILRGYEERHPGKVKVLRNSVNRRQGGAKNAGLQAASGDWIGFMDSDDWAAPDFYEKLLVRAEETGADMAGCDYSLVTEHTMEPGKVVRCNSSEQTGVLTPEKHGKLILRTGSMVVKIYKHSVIRENGLCFPEGVFYEDNCAGPLWSLYFSRFERVEEPLYFYYQHGASTVHRVTEEKCRDRMAAANLLYRECAARGFLKEYRAEIEYRYTELHFVNTLFSYMLGARPKRLSFVGELKREILGVFPAFQDNAYYRELTGAEEKEMVALLMKSKVLFYGYYRALSAYRSVKKGLSGNRRRAAGAAKRRDK